MFSMKPFNSPSHVLAWTFLAIKLTAASSALPWFLLIAVEHILFLLKIRAAFVYDTPLWSWMISVNELVEKEGPIAGRHRPFPVDWESTCLPGIREGPKTNPGQVCVTSFPSLLLMTCHRRLNSHPLVRILAPLVQAVESPASSFLLSRAAPIRFCICCFDVL